MKFLEKIKEKCFGKTKAERYGRKLKLQQQFCKAAMVGNAVTVGYTAGGRIGALASFSLFLTGQIIGAYFLVKNKKIKRSEKGIMEANYNDGFALMSFIDREFTKDINVLKEEMGLSGEVYFFMKNIGAQNSQRKEGVYIAVSSLGANMALIFSEEALRIQPEDLLPLIAHEFSHIVHDHERREFHRKESFQAAWFMNAFSVSVQAFWASNFTPLISFAGGVLGHEMLTKKLRRLNELEADLGAVQAVGAKDFYRAFGKTFADVSLSLDKAAINFGLKMDQSIKELTLKERVMFFVEGFRATKSISLFQTHPKKGERLQVIAELVQKEDPDFTPPAFEVVINKTTFEAEYGENAVSVFKSCLSDEIFEDYGHRNLKVIFADAQENEDLPANDNMPALETPKQDLENRL